MVLRTARQLSVSVLSCPGVLSLGSRSSRPLSVVSESWEVLGALGKLGGICACGSALSWVSSPSKFWVGFCNDVWVGISIVHLPLCQALGCPITCALCYFLFFFLKEGSTFYLFIYLFNFIFGCVGSSFLCKGFLQLRRVGATLHCGAQASHCRGLSRCGAQAPDAQAQ